MISKIIRVFPRRTAATPDDEFAFVGEPPLNHPDADEVHVSVTFTWDVPKAQYLYNAWRLIYGDCVRMGGPAFGDHAGDFEPGMYLKSGYTITSRGCPNRCNFCLVPKREGPIRTLRIRDGWNLQDNNILACPRPHIESVLNMLARQRHPIIFAGGLEARRLQPWFARKLATLRIESLFTAYDRPCQKGHVERAVKIIRETTGWSDSRSLRKITCYVLVGYPGDTIRKAGQRLDWILSINATPFPMYYQHDDSKVRIESLAWKQLLRPYRRRTILYSRSKTPEINKQECTGFLFSEVAGPMALADRD
ncbi:MAG: hypothetical protein KAV00_03455 [Phycisphaerae bacterium]|nr:hypothetical protein [Phycisphaerae bacterium]